MEGDSLYGRSTSLEGQKCYTRFYRVFLAADNLKAGRKPRIINKSWISEDVLAMVQENIQDN
jgi:hypothetical protein